MRCSWMTSEVRYSQIRNDAELHRPSLRANPPPPHSHLFGKIMSARRRWGVRGGFSFTLTYHPPHVPSPQCTLLCGTHRCYVAYLTGRASTPTLNCTPTRPPRTSSAAGSCASWVQSSCSAGRYTPCLRPQMRLVRKLRCPLTATCRILL